MPRTILMGDPTHFSVLGGANPHTRNILGVRKRVDAAERESNGTRFARALIAEGTEVCVIAAHPGLTGLSIRRTRDSSIRLKRAARTSE